MDGKRNGNGVPPPVQPPTHAPGMEQPVLFWAPSISASGITVYNGDKFPAWRNSIIVGSLTDQHAERITLTEQGWENQPISMLGELGRRIRDVKVGPDVFLYMTTDDKDGAVLKIEPADASAPIAIAATSAL